MTYTTNCRFRMCLGLTVLVVVDRVGHGEQGGVVLHPLLHAVDDRPVGFNEVFFQSLQVGDDFLQREKK